MNTSHFSDTERELEWAAASLETAPLGEAEFEQELEMAAWELGRASMPMTELEAGTCTPAPGIPNSQCSAYASNGWWLPLAYVNNAICACRTTPNTPTANCVRAFLQRRLAATPTWLKSFAAWQKLNPFTYNAFVQSVLTPRIYRDHVDAYRACCCPSGPAPYPAWVGVTTVPIQPCSLVGASIRSFGSCSGTPGAW